MHKQQIEEASKMWRSGEEGSVIAKHFGITASTIFDIASKYRHMFPNRNRTNRATYVVDSSSFGDVPDNCMTWITEGGALVTLPRVSMAICPRVA